MEVPEVLSHLANSVLTWIGFGTLVGLLAKAIMPGRDPEGALTTVIMGILGAVVGAGCLAYFSENLRVSPLSPLGFVVATCGAFVLLGLHRLMSGRGYYLPFMRWTRWGRPRRKVSVITER
jgi:uncharacterized membrane protein YeaQ/YmgE (transglycosylase-associated protein family)